jgi:hypothetical protein
MKVLPTEKQTRIIDCLTEGNSIRSTERITGTHRDSIMWHEGRESPPRLALSCHA